MVFIYILWSFSSILFRIKTTKGVRQVTGTNQGQGQVLKTAKKYLKDSKTMLKIGSLHGTIVVTHIASMCQGGVLCQSQSLNK